MSAPIDYHQSILHPSLRHTTQTPRAQFKNLTGPQLSTTINTQSHPKKKKSKPQNRENKMSWTQKQFTLPPRSRGSYLITDHVVSELPELRSYKVGLVHLFVQHTSCALSLNENWDDDVRADMSDALDRIAPEDRKGNLYRHDAEGLDDMPVRLPSLSICIWMRLWGETLTE
jgi:secondary thiamine-phosphate synthase enzyme